MADQEGIRRFLKTDTTYDPEAYSLIWEAFGYTINTLDRVKQRLSVKELCEGIRDYAIAKFGCLAKIVLETCGLKETRDFGQIVETLVRYGFMVYNEKNEIDQFEGFYDFNEVFCVRPIFNCNADRLNIFNVEYVPKGKYERERIRRV